MMKKTTKRKQPTRKEQARRRAAARVAVILADESTPDFLSDVLTDMLIDLSNETAVDVTTPEVAQVALPLMLVRAEKQGLRQCSGQLESSARKARAQAA